MLSWKRELCGSREIDGDQQRFSEKLRDRERLNGELDRERLSEELDQERPNEELDRERLNEELDWERPSEELDRERPNEELEFNKVDTLMMQITRLSRAMAEANESCRYFEELISKKDKVAAELEAELKTYSTLNISKNQHLLTKANLQASIQRVRNEIERREKENRKEEEETAALMKRMEIVKKRMTTKLNEMKDHYCSQFVDKEKAEQIKKKIEMKERKIVLTAYITELKQKRRKETEWKNFVEAVIKLVKCKQGIKNEYNSFQQYEASIQMLQTAIRVMKQVDSSLISRKEAGNMNEVMKCNSSLLAKQPDLTTVTTIDGESVNTSSSSNLLNQGYGTTFARSNFNTSLSLLKIPHSKLGKKLGDCSLSTKICSGGPLETLFSKNHPPIAVALSSHQVQHQEATPDYHKTTSSQVIDTNNMSHSSSVKSQHYAKGKTMWDGSSKDRSVSKSQGNPRFAVKPISLSPAIVSSTNAQSLETPSHRSRDMSCTSTIPKALETPLSKTKLSFSPEVWKNVGISSLKMPNTKLPLQWTKGTEAPTSKGLGLSHLNDRGMSGKSLLARSDGIPVMSRVVGIPSVPPTSFGICSASYQKTYQKYSGYSLDSTKLSRLSLTSKSETCKEAQQKFPAFSDLSEETPIKRKKFDQSALPKISVTSDVSVGDGLPGSFASTLPSNQEETTSSSQVPQPIEVDGNEYNKIEETSLPTSQEDIMMTEDSTGNKTQLQDSSLEMTQNFQTHNEAVNEICSSQFMKSSSAKNTPQTSKDSEQSSTPIISTPKKALENNPEMGCTTPSLVVSISNSVSSPHSTNSIPSKSSFQFCNKKSLEYKESPVVSDMPNHSSQQFSSSNNPIEDSSFPFLFQNNLQANTVGSQPFSLFESPVAESTARSTSGNSGSNFFMFENTSNLRQENTNTGLFSFNLGSDGESSDHTSGFLSSLFDSSPGNNNSSDENTGFCLF
ncbi:mucin-17-like [Portunus trituberculatus]|uniref:mucin-17-like n=1 Tax=Portunus trituberculatus TaxID=210409 RepID=UPI001E1CE78A|nr:mucin-17-like [Portunus trituberculatus]